MMAEDDKITPAVKLATDRQWIGLYRIAVAGLLAAITSIGSFFGIRVLTGIDDLGVKVATEIQAETDLRHRVGTIEQRLSEDDGRIDAMGNRVTVVETKIDSLHR
jgi:hypothetical protein